MTEPLPRHECRPECFAGYGKAGRWAEHIDDYRRWEIRYRLGPDGWLWSAEHADGLTLTSARRYPALPRAVTVARARIDRRVSQP